MEVRLRVASGQKAGQIVSLWGTRFYIGRSEDCQLRPRGDAVSRHHCVLLLEGNSVLARDLGSKNGTFVNDVRIHPEVELTSGDRLRVGQLEFEVLIAGGAEGKPRPTAATLEDTASQAVAATSTVSEEDFQFEQWLAELDRPSAPKTAPTGHEREEEPDMGTKGGAPREAGKPTESSARKPASHRFDPKGAVAWNTKPAAKTTGYTAGKALKQLLRGR